MNVQVDIASEMEALKSMAGLNWDSSGDFPEATILAYNPPICGVASVAGKLGGIIYRGAGRYDVWRWATPAERPYDRRRAGVGAEEAVSLLADIRADRRWPLPRYLVAYTDGLEYGRHNDLDTAYASHGETAPGSAILIDSRSGEVLAA